MDSPDLMLAPSAGLGQPPFARRVAGIHGSPIDSSISLLQRQTRPVVSFAMGCPGADAIPSETIRAIASDLLARDGDAALNYGPTEGERSLRSALLSLIPRMLGQEIAAEELLVTSGGMQGIDLTCKMLLDPGDLVVVEEPLYSNTATVIGSYQGRLLPVPIDHDGMIVERIPELVAAAGARPKLINVIPNFQNPSGATLSLERRQRLLRLADEYDCVVLEDDPYGLLHFGARCPPSLRALSGNSARVVAVHTFSKVLAPGLRVGWIAADPRLVAKMIDARQGMDTCTNVLSQQIVAEFIARGHFEMHVAELRRLYAERRAAMDDALNATFGSQVEWSRPEGGFFLWITLPAGIDAGRLFPVALEEGVAFVPGAAFSNSGRFRNAARLCFAYPPAIDMRRGVGRLKAAIATLSAQEERQ
jgi:2-aminoadipate transaminase